MRSVTCPRVKALREEWDADVTASPGTYSRWLEQKVVAIEAEVERLREVLQKRDDTLAMVVGLPGFARLYPQFHAGIVRLLNDDEPVV